MQSYFISKSASAIDSVSSSRNKVFDHIILQEYNKFIKEDPNVKYEAFFAHYQMVDAQDDNFDIISQIMGSNNEQKKTANNLLTCLRLSKFFKRKQGNKVKLTNNKLIRTPIFGKLVTLLLTTSGITLIFLQSLIISLSKKKTRLGFNDFFYIDSKVLLDFGGLNTNQIRSGEFFRLFWSVWLHTGWIHLAFNLLCQMQYFLIIEPDWGFTRTSLLFLISAFTGNLLSSVCNPCSTTVGSSGGLFGLMGAMLSYCIEYWMSIPNPCIIFTFSGFVLTVSLLLGFRGTTDNWAHMGGMIGGTLFGLSTITKLAGFENMKQPIRHAFSLRSPKSPNNPTKNNSTESYSTYPNSEANGVTNVSKKLTKGPNFICGSQSKLFSSYSFDGKTCIVRVISTASLITFCGILLNYLYFNFNYTPPGHITYNSIRSCCCCFLDTLTETKKSWTCNYCDAKTLSGLEWREVCLL